MTTAPTRVLGLAGGIGAGKSAVAAILRDLGCVVSDSDARAKALLETPPVRDQIVAWWGPELLTPDARIDRVRLAAVVFADPDHRRRLEGLIHPLLKTERDAALARARAARAPAFVIDAPLLFEAGLHRECDAVIFVDAPRELRLRRVAQSRGWSPDELARREAAQWPVDQKRAAAAVVIDNASDPSSLRDAVAAALATLLAAPPRTPPASNL